MDLEIKSFDGEGYMPLIGCRGWRVALINSCENLLEKNLKKLERHFSSDEAFVLIEGDAVLFIGKEMKRYPMEKCKVYNIKREVWHCIALGEKSKVVVVESNDVCEKNSDIYFL